MPGTTLASTNATASFSDVVQASVSTIDNLPCLKLAAQKILIKSAPHKQAKPPAVRTTGGLVLFASIPIVNLTLTRATQDVLEFIHEDLEFIGLADGHPQVVA